MELGNTTQTDPKYLLQGKLREEAEGTQKEEQKVCETSSNLRLPHRLLLSDHRGCCYSTSDMIVFPPEVRVVAQLMHEFNWKAKC